MLVKLDALVTLSYKLNPSKSLFCVLHILSIIIFVFYYSNNNNDFLIAKRLEFLGDAVLDYLITIHLYYKFPGLSPGLLTDMRSAQVNNDCYARSSVKAGLQKHILHLSQHLHKHIRETVDSFGKLSSESTFGWETETCFPKVSCYYLLPV